MKKLLHTLVILFICLAANAQQNYFIYVQTENKQPFYVKIKDKILSSSASGYLVIPKLNTGEYPLTVGFPKDKWPQQKFNLAIGTVDAGYLLKNYEEKGWGMYNIQTMEVAMNGATAPIKTAVNKDDEFANVLSTATNTKIVVPVAKVEPVKVEPVKTEPVKTEPTKVEPVKKETVKKEVVKKEVIKEEPINTNNKIEKISSKKDGKGRTIKYAVITNNIVEEVTIFIPAEVVKETVKEEVIEEKQIIKEEKPTEAEREVVVKEEKPKPAKKVAVVKEVPAKDKKFLDIDMKKEAEKKVSTTEVTSSDGNTTLTFNSDCKANASEDDFYKTRKKMVAEDNDDDMVEAARKAFKTKCYSVEQIKNLSLLFLKDIGKYKFFDAAYVHTTDTQNFGSLQAELKDEYYISRFKAMLKN
jgi:Domain of unknown function (DUF4476)